MTEAVPVHGSPATDQDPIERILEVIATQYDTPDAGMRACVRRIEEARPALLDVLSRAAAHGLRRQQDRTLLFRGLHIMGVARVTAACQPLLRLLRRPADEVEDTLGDSLTETLPKIVAGVFDGDSPALFAAIADRRIDEAARWSLLTASTFLTWEKRIDLEATKAFLHRFGTERLAPAHDAAWIGWGESVALLGLADLAPAVEAVWATFPKQLADLRFFRETLADAQMEPGDPGRFEANNGGYLDDIVDALAWTRPRDDGTAYVRDDLALKPVHNPLRHIGRNDPCPCGSGRKFKKCCGAA